MGSDAFDWACVMVAIQRITQYWNMFEERAWNWG